MRMGRRGTGRAPDEDVLKIAPMGFFPWKGGENS